MKKTLIVLAAVLGVAATAGAAEARSGVNISYSSGGGYYPQPVYYQPAPVYYPPSVYYGSAYYPPYTPAYRVNYWSGPRWHGGHGRGHGHGHGRGHRGWR